MPRPSRWPTGRRNRRCAKFSRPKLHVTGYMVRSSESARARPVGNGCSTPSDGTTAFLAGRPIFGTLIALLVEGFPVLGLIDQPILGERWLGVKGRPTSFNGAPVRTRPCPALAGASIATTGPHYFDMRQGKTFMALAAATDHKRMVMGGDCYNYAMLASGHLDLVCEAGLKLHDFAALVPVVEGAGGQMCDWAGDPLHKGSSGEVLALGDPARLDDVLEAMAG